MTTLHNPSYCCALRMKAGELEGVRVLAPDVADSVLPRFILPPRKERDQSQPLLIDAAETPDISVALSQNWGDRIALIDATYILDEYGRSDLIRWLPSMFERARNAGARPVPCANLTDLGSQELPAFKLSISETDMPKFAVIIPSDDLVEPSLRENVLVALTGLGVTPHECAVLADFGDTEFSDPSVVAPVISFALEALQEIGSWQRIVYQGTHYPEVNPAKDGEAQTWPRNEWAAWRMAVHSDPSIAEQMTFGDYAADCAKIAFGAGKAAAIRHLRYATSTSWRVQRAPKSGTDRARMHSVFKAIADCGDFAGSGFSAADAVIARGASDPLASPGNAKTWRQLNTTHHITQVVSDIARLDGKKIKSAPAGTEEQLPLPV